VKGLDIFSGAGGSSTGARDAGVTLVGAIDMCPVATATYRANFPKARVLTSKLEDVDLKLLRRQIGPIDILLASPECTNHSCAKGGARRDESSRATAMQVVKFAKAFQPRWLVMENVVHMKPWSKYKGLKRMLTELGYHIAEQIVDASDHGVAQNRKRLFIVGDRLRQPRLVSGKQRGRKKTAASILEPKGTWRTSSLTKLDRAKATLERAKRGFKELGTASPFLLVYYGSDGAGGWQPLDRPLRTITTVDRFALVQPGPFGPEMRMLQVPELRRAMGFPETYKLPIGNRRARIRLLGNGVCPPVMKKVVQALTSR
jgi:DNA (cytosine-5)-methyltransferase 1